MQMSSEVWKWPPDDDTHTYEQTQTMLNSIKQRGRLNGCCCSEDALTAANRPTEAVNVHRACRRAEPLVSVKDGRLWEFTFCSPQKPAAEVCSDLQLWPSFIQNSHRGFSEHFCSIIHFSSVRVQDITTPFFHCSPLPFSLLLTSSSLLEHRWLSGSRWSVLKVSFSHWLFQRFPADNNLVKTSWNIWKSCLLMKCYTTLYL